MTDYKATPEDWELQSQWASDCADARCLLELRTRVETLEAATHKHIAETSANILALASRVEALEANSKPTPNSSQIGSSLVSRVALAISGIEYGLERDEEAVHWASEARATIREVAAWMREERSWIYEAETLEREVGR